MLKIVLTFFFGLLISCGRSDFHLTINMNWKIVSINNDITLYEGYNPDVPLRAWSIIIPNNKREKLIPLILNQNTINNIWIPCFTHKLYNTNNYKRHNIKVNKSA